jgi:hypothetical protein
MSNDQHSKSVRTPGEAIDRIVRDVEASSAMSRRDLGRLLALAGVGVGASLIGVQIAAAQSQQPTRPQPPRPGMSGMKPPESKPAQPKSILDDVIKQAKTRDWTVKVALRLDSYQTPANQIGPSKNLTIVPFKFQTAAILFPVLMGTATSETDVKQVISRLRFDNRDQDARAVFDANFHSGAQFGRWELKDKEGRSIDLEIEIPITCWQTLYDETRAANAKWPEGNRWSKVAQSTFGPQNWVESNSKVVLGAVDRWCSGKPPTDVPPAQLAKFLAGRVLEEVQPSGVGLVASSTGMLQGFQLQGAERTLQDRRGSIHDITCTLAAVYRAAGLPARTVIGYDVTESKGSKGLKTRSGGDGLASWVEFCLYDTQAQKDVWVPVDINRLRRSSNRVPPLDRTWKFFGTNDATDNIMPLAFHFHPPTTVIAHGSPCLWGWFTTPETQVAEQSLRFDAITTPIKPGDNKKKGIGK